jgi:hypothetical protein
MLPTDEMEQLMNAVSANHTRVPFLGYHR